MPSSSPNLQLSLLRRELDLRRREKELRQENQIEFFQPHAKQCAFFSASHKKRRYARTGNRFGKSEMGAVEDISFALGYRPFYKEGDPRRTLGIPPYATKGIIVTTDWDKSKEVFTGKEVGRNIGKLFKYIPKAALLGDSKNHCGAIDIIKVRHISGDTSTIYLDTVASFKQNGLSQESGAWDWAHFDEPVPEAMYKAIARGFVGRGGKCWFCCTPLTEPWIDMKFTPDLESASREDLEDFTCGNNWMMTGTMHDNPYNSAQDIADFKEDLTLEEAETRITGIPAAYSGIVYKEFSWNDHVLREPPEGWKGWTPPADWSIRYAIDYHPRKPHHVLFIATSPHDVNIAYSEIFFSCLMSELVVEIKSILNGREATVPGIIDPLAATPNRVTDLSALEEVLRLGLPVIPATKDPHNGILRVKELLKTRDRCGRPVFFVSSSLPRFLFEISRGYIWDGETNKPVKDKDDAMENLYRLALQGLSYIEPATSADYEPIHLLDLPENVLDIGEWGDPFAEEKATTKRAVHSLRYRK